MELSVCSSLHRPDFHLDVDLKLPLKGITVLFGSSGSGKTTLLRCIAGLEPQAVGQVLIGPDEWQNFQGLFTPPHLRETGYIFQNARLFTHLNVQENLVFGHKRTPTNKHIFTFERITKTLGLTRLLDRRPQSLSGGEAQLVAIGRALMTSPKLLLMDEPMAALDSQRKSKLLPRIEAIRDELGIPIVYVTHSIKEASRLADDLVIISEGKVAAQGHPADILSRLDLRPLTGRFDAGARIEARVVNHDIEFGLTHLRFAGHDLHVPILELPIKTLVRAHIRARDVSLSLDHPTAISIQNILTGTIQEIQENGSPHAEINVDVGGTLINARVTRKTVAELSLKPTDNVFVLIKAVAIDKRSLGHPDIIEA